MRIVLLTHPDWLGSTSMPRFSSMIERGMKERGYAVSSLTAPPRLSRIPTGSPFVQKWLGYADQFALFPSRLRRAVKTMPDDTVFVVTDQALGMWVPHICHRPHVIHCHDFMAYKSARGDFPENPTSATGRKYQALIRNGFSRGNHFISVSKRTQEDLESLLPNKNYESSFVHNGLNGNFRQLSSEVAKEILAGHLTAAESSGFLLHVGGNQWYKNRMGVIELYRAWCAQTANPLPLWMVGAQPTELLRESANEMPGGGSVRFLTGLTDKEVVAAYNLAALFLFPSLEEGFGWPIAEAMACGTMVVTTDEAPMTEVGGDAAIYHRRYRESDLTWADDGAREIESCLTLPKTARDSVVQNGFEQSAKFSTDNALNEYEKLYARALGEWSNNRKADKPQ